MRYHKRQTYRLIEYLGDIGGLVQLIWIGGSLLVGFIIERQFKAQMVSETYQIQKYASDQTEYYQTHGNTISRKGGMHVIELTSEEPSVKSDDEDNLSAHGKPSAQRSSERPRQSILSVTQLSHQNTITSNTQPKKARVNDDLSQIDSQDEEHEKSVHGQDEGTDMTNTLTDSRNLILKTISFKENSSNLQVAPLIPEKRKKMKFSRSQSEGEQKAIENALEKNVASPEVGQKEGKAGIKNLTNPNNMVEAFNDTPQYKRAMKNAMNQASTRPISKRPKRQQLYFIYKMIMNRRNFEYSLKKAF